MLKLRLHSMVNHIIILCQDEQLKELLRFPNLLTRSQQELEITNRDIITKDSSIDDLQQTIQQLREVVRKQEYKITEMQALSIKLSKAEFELIRLDNSLAIRDVDLAKSLELAQSQATQIEECLQEIEYLNSENENKLRDL